MDKRRKAFWGALVGGLVGGAASLFSSAYSGNKQKRLQEESLEEQQRAQNKQDTLNMAQQLTAGYSDQAYVDDFYKKIRYKMGGNNKVSMANIVRPKRRKAEGGGGFDAAGMLNAMLPSLFNSASTITSANIAASANRKPIESMAFMANTPKGHLKTPDYLVNNNQYMGYLMRCGGLKRIKR